MEATSVCPNCGRRLRLPESLEGQQVRCPDCSTVFTAWRVGPANRPPAPEAIQHRAPAASAKPAHFRFQDEPDRLPSPPDDPFDFESRQERLPEQLPGGGIAVAAMVLLAVNILIDLGSMAAVASLMLPGLEFDLPFTLLSCVQLLVFFLTGIVFCVWMHRSYKNLSLFGLRNLSYSPGWAAGAFFVPILNLFRPCQIAQEMWRASNPDIPEGEPWRRSPGSGLIAGWWTFWILGFIISCVAFAMSKGEMANLEAAVVASMLEGGVSILAAVFAIVMVQQLRSRQEQKLRSLLRF